MKSRDFQRAGALALVLGLSVALACPQVIAKRHKKSHGKDVAQTAASKDSCAQLSASLKKSGVERTLHGKGPYTLFAPTNEAFIKSKAKLAEASKQSGKLTNVLKYHVLPKKISSADIKSNGALKTIEGESLITQVKDGVIFIDGAKVIEADIPCSNGQLFIIDEVLIPERGR